MIVERLWGTLFAARRAFPAIVVVAAVSLPALASARTATGEANFTKLCSACHTVGGGKRVGPDLLGINDRRSEDWLVRWITSPQSMVRSGDPAAVRLFEEFNTQMPDTALSPDEIRGVLEYIRTGAAGAAVKAPVQAATPEDVSRGRELFQGGTHLTNGGPACSSCHHVTHDNVIGGGVLAKDLTDAFTRLGAPSIQAILHAPPFPVMRQAYDGRPITENEAVALAGYLKTVSESAQSFDQPREDSMKLLGGGLVGLCILMGLYSFTWRRRKKGLVSDKVFDRQVRSQ